MIVATARGQIFVISNNGLFGTISEYSTSGTLVKANLANSSFEVVFGAIAVSGSTLYLSDSTGKISTFTTSGTAVNPSLITGFGQSPKIALSDDGTKLFVVDYGDGTNGTIGEYDAATGAAVNAALVQGLYFVGSIAVSGSNLYVIHYDSGATNRMIGQYTVDATTGTVTASNDALVSQVPGGNGIAVSGTDLYVVGASDGSIGVYDFSGQTVTSSLDSDGDSAQGIAAAGSNLYVLGGNFGDTILGYAVSGGDQSGSSSVLASNLGNLSGIAVLSDQGGGGGLLPAVTLAQSGPSSDGAILHFLATTGAGLAVRIQSSSTPGDESSWLDLPDGHGGALTEDPSHPGNYEFLDSNFKDIGTTFYPTGSAVSFRAIAAKTGFIDSKSPALGTYLLTRAVLSIRVALSSTTDPVAGAISHLGDELTYTFTVTNSGSATAKNLQVVANVPSYVHTAKATFNAKTVRNSASVTLTSGSTAGLFVGQRLSGPDFHSGTTIASIKDAMHFTSSAPATGNDTFATDFFYDPAPIQFGLTDIALDSGNHRMISSGGTFVTTAGMNQIVWAAGDLDAGSSLSETFTLQLASSVNTSPRQAIGITDDYTTYGATFQPPYSATGASSGSPEVSTEIRPPISFTAVANAGTVAPGGDLTYALTISNLTDAMIPGLTVADITGSKLPKTAAVEVIDVPQFTRYAGVAYVGRKGSPAALQLYHQNGDASQVLILPGALYPKGDAKHRDTVTINVTFQVQWVDPAIAPTISTINYAAAFLSPADPNTNSNPILELARAAVAALSKPEAAGNADFVVFLADPSRSSAFSKNLPGLLSTSVQGSLANRPVLNATKVLDVGLANVVDQGEGFTSDLVKPGDQISFTLTGSNSGASEADDVFIEDVMPDSATYVAGSANVVGKTDSAMKSNLTVIPDSDGHHLRFTGLHLDPNDAFVISYTVKIASGAAAPAPGTILDPGVAINPNNGLPEEESIGSSSIPETPPGDYLAVPLEVISPIQFAQPIIRPLPVRPRVSENVSNTIAALTAFYKKHPTSVPLTSLSDATAFYPGFQRYYIHYENTGKPVAGATLSVPLPAHTAFYRAAFVQLAGNSDHGALGGLPGKIIANPAGAKIVEPPVGGTGGTVTFTFKNKLSVAEQGDVVVEVIVAPDAVQAAGSFVGDPAIFVTMSDPAAPAVARASLRDQANVDPPVLLQPHSSAAAYVATLALDDEFLLTQSVVPQLGIMKTAPKSVPTGGTFEMTIAVYNFGGVAVEYPGIFTKLPQGTAFVQATGQGQYFVGDTPETEVLNGIPNPGDEIFFDIATNNGQTPDGGYFLQPHTGGAVTLTLMATGDAGSSIDDAESSIESANGGEAVAPLISISVTVADVPVASATNTVISPGLALLHAVINKTDVAILDLGAGNALVQGVSSIVSQGAGNIVSQGAGNIVAAGAGNLFPIGNTTIAFLIQNQNGLVAQKTANILVSGTTIVSQGAGNIVAAGAGNIVNTNGSNIVSQGAGNIVNTNGSNIVSQGAGNIVSQGAGNIVAAGAGNIVSQGAGNIVAAGAGNIVAAGAGNILSSSASSFAAVHTEAGNSFMIGGGSFKPAGP